jgi:hypothetical protein
VKSRVAFVLFGLLVGLPLGACKEGSGSAFIDRGVCDTLIECASNLAPDARDEYIATYGEGGSCWTGGPNQWAACRNACLQALDGLNLIAQVTGETCGTCMSDADCSTLGPNATCEDGVCVGAGMADGGSETGSEAEAGS